MCPEMINILQSKYVYMFGRDCCFRLNIFIEEKNLRYLIFVKEDDENHTVYSSDMISSSVLH